MRKLNLLIMISLMLTLTAASTLIPATFAQDPDESQMSIPDRQKKARRQKGLNAAAKITGSYVYQTGVYPHGQGVKDDPNYQLPTILEYSETVITGYVIDNICKLYGPPGEDEINTEYKVQIVEVLKGKKNLESQTIEVNNPGGKVAFPDGTTAEEITPGRKMRNDGRYVLFLRELTTFSQEGKRIKLLFALGGGIFEITPEQKILFCGTAIPPEKYNGYALQDFLQEIKNLVEKEQPPKK
jgi:hypothetical protein